MARAKVKSEFVVLAWGADNPDDICILRDCGKNAEQCRRWVKKMGLKGGAGQPMVYQVASLRGAPFTRDVIPKEEVKLRPWAPEFPEGGEVASPEPEDE